jgi:hypothetical protein
MNGKLIRNATASLLTGGYFVSFYSESHTVLYMAICCTYLL